MSYSEQYSVIISEFIKENISIFDNAKVFDTDKKDIFKYFPVHGKRSDPEFIGNNIVVKAIIQKFFDDYILDEEIVFDINGHSPELNNNLVKLLNDKNFNYLKQEVFHQISSSMLFDMLHHYDFIKTGKIKYSTHLFLMSDDAIKIIDSQKCSSCDKYLSLYLDFKTKKISHYQEIEKCPLENIPKEVEVILNVPSKKLVFLNNPASFIYLERENKYKVSINSLKGCIEETEMYAAHNIGFFFIANSFPAILQKEGEIIFTHGYDEEDEDENGHNPNFSDYTLKGNVCADLWWYTLLDYDLFVSLCKEKSVDHSEIAHVVVDISSDKCTVKHSLKAHKEGHDSGIFSTIKY
jgi:hypothetical protein